jgi:hypothetical protein
MILAYILKILQQELLVKIANYLNTECSIPKTHIK